MKVEYKTFGNYNISKLIRPSKYDNQAGIDIIIPRERILKANDITIIDTHLGVILPDGFMGLLLPRSSTSHSMLTVQPCPVDPHYDGEIHLMVINHSNVDIHIGAGEALAQLVIMPFVSIELTDQLVRRGNNWNGSSEK